MSQESLISDLSRLIEGEVSEEASALDRASVDYGGLIRRSPRAVVRPRTADDVSRTVRYAYERDLPVSPRGGGYSFSGQALNEGGVVLDMAELCAIGPVEPREEWFEAQAGARWKNVVKATLQHGRIPPVLTSFLGTSVGGTLSAGGVGFSSFRYGAQVDQCLELEVVLHDGEIARCSQEENADLFEHALCGFGQFGVITRARVRLRKALPHTRTYFLQYNDLDAHLADQVRLIEEKRVDFIEGILQPCFHGRRAVNGRRALLLSSIYPLNLTVEAESAEAIDDSRVLADLHFSKWVYAEDLSIADFLMLGHTDEGDFSPRIAQVFTDVLIPWSAAESFIRKVEAHVYPRMLQVEYVRMGALTLDTLTRPMLRIPQEPLILGIGLYSQVPKALGENNLAVAKGYMDLAVSMGGTYYLPGSVRLDEARLARHFGDRWPTLCEVKRRYDPKGLFNPGLFVQDGAG
jgi:cytokinin dehydrogenase